MPEPIEPVEITDTETLGLAIRARRKRDGLTLAETAGLTNVGIRFLSELENGKPTVRLDKVLKVVAALGLCLQIVPITRIEQTWER
ncbi:MAG: helix-turn-helix transcriptional regulator [bacterium]|nr:helix-turn-helix transcriptional regulator [bacterium]